jgi:predicted dehydrogenase
MEKTLRIGLIGCGEIGRLRAASLAHSNSFQLDFVSDNDRGRGESLASRYSVRFEPDWEKAIDGDVDAVVVSTPPPFHGLMCVEALKQGKHVLCEKPLARNPQECRQILKAADRAGRLIATGFNYRFYPAVKVAYETLRSGLIGELDHIRSFAGHPGGSEFTHPWVHDVNVMGGGALLDNGIHIIDLTHYFLGEVAEVQGYRTGNVWKFEGCEDNGFALLKNRDGKIATLQASWSEWRGYRFWIEVFGTRGCVRAAYPPMFAQATWSESEGEKLRRKNFFFLGLQVVERIRSFEWTVIKSFVEEFDAFAQAIAGKKTEGATGYDGLRAIEIAHAVYKSSECGSSVLITDWNSGSAH